MKVTAKCEYCGKTVTRYPSEIRSHVFCSRECTKHFTSSRMRDFNESENPMNQKRKGTLQERSSKRKPATNSPKRDPGRRLEGES